MGSVYLLTRPPTATRAPVANIETPAEYIRGEWGILCALEDSWGATDIPSTLRAALGPFLAFVRRHRTTTIPWGQRLYILWTGKFPPSL
jgi:hypothetical protein